MLFEFSLEKIEVDQLINIVVVVPLEMQGLESQRLQISISICCLLSLKERHFCYD